MGLGIDRQVASTASAPAPAQRTADDHVVANSALTVGAVGAAATAMPSAFGHGGGRVPLFVAGAAGLLGAGVGALGGLTSRAIDGDDAVRGGTLLAGAGAVTGLGGLAATAALRGRGPRDIGAITASVGALTAVAGASTAGSAALARTDLPGADAPGVGGAAAGLVGAAVTVGALAATGALRSAPSVDAAARTIIAAHPASLVGIGPKQAASFMAERTALAQAELERLPRIEGSDPWRDIGKGRAFLRGVASRDDIAATMGSAVRQPKRLFVGIGEVDGTVPEADRPRARAELMLRRFDAAGGTGFGRVHVIPATATGDTTEMGPLAVEYASRGDVITLMTQTTAEEPFTAFDDVGQAARTLDHVLRGLKERIDSVPAGQPRPKLDVSALCYGALPAIDLRAGAEGLARYGVGHEVYLAPPAVWRSARVLAGQLDRGELAGTFSRSRAELLDATQAGAAPKLVVATQPDDPFRIGFHSTVVPFPQPAGRPYVPIVSVLNTAKQWTAPTGTSYREVAHELEATAAPALNLGFGLGLSRAQVDAIEQRGVLFTTMRHLADQDEAARATTQRA